MRWVVLAVFVVACSSKPDPVPPKRPNNELIVGVFERHKPEGETAIRFDRDGSFRIAKNKGELDRTPHVADGKYTLEGDQLTLSNEHGSCTESDGEKVGKYKVVVSKIGIRFQKVDDSCQRRAAMDGQTWWRVQ
jgi:hypothetical protein